MILKEPKNQINFKKNIFFANSARESFSLILKYIFFKSDKKILMPSYIGETEKEGSGVFDPVRENFIDFSFYKLNNVLSPNLEELEKFFITGKYKAILIIHYFGFIHVEMQKVQSLCTKYNITLIEDCAHGNASTQTNQVMGSFGDFSFFSIHKLIASENGGLFKVNNNKFLNEFKTKNQLLYDTKNIMAYFSSNFNTINNLRVKNYNYYLKNWPENNIIKPMYPILKSAIVPLNFPTIISKNLREKIYFMLLERKVITCALYHQMIPEINQKVFNNSYQISSSILNFPVHQDTEIKDIDFILKKIQEVINLV